MKILALDSTTKVLSIGIYDDSRGLNSRQAEYNLEVGKSLSRLIGASTQRVLSAFGISLDEIDYFCAGSGPGSFTGMRVGLSFIKALAWSNNKKIAGVSSLDIIAEQVNDENRAIVPVIDARRGLVYACIYRKRNGELKKISAYMLTSVSELLKQLPAGCLLAGDALSLYSQDFLKSGKQVKLMEKDFWYPKAHNLVNLALKRIKGMKLYSASSFKPLYLYPKECQIKK